MIKYFFIRVKVFLYRTFKVVPILGFSHFILGVLMKILYLTGNKYLALRLYIPFSKSVIQYMDKQIQETKKIKPEICLNTIKNERIWTCWLQGEDNAPEIVKQCINSIRKHSGHRDVVVITFENYKKYVNLPDYIETKYRQGIISSAHFSDLIRCALLYLYGGLWIDSTVFIVKNIPDIWFQKEFYSIKMKKQCFSPSKARWCCFFMSGQQGNIVHHFMYNGLLEYWKYNKVCVDYLFMDYILCIGYESISNIKMLVDDVPYNNESVNFFLKNGNKRIDEKCFIQILRLTCFFKLTYKNNFGEIKKESYISYLLNKNG